MATKHQHYYESETDLRESFENGLNSGTLSTKFDEDCMTSKEDLYEEWKHETLRYSSEDLDWKDDYHDDDLKEDEN